MSQNIFSHGLIGLVGAAFSLPAVSLLLALIITIGLITFTRPQNTDQRLSRLSAAAATAVDARYARERRALGVCALVVIVIFMTENVVRGYFLNTADVVSWWRFALPIFVSLVGLGVLLAMIRFRGTGRPGRPAGLGVRRTWASFGPRTGVVGAAVAVVALLVTTTAAGIASSPDDQGRYIYLEISIPNESIDPVRQWFYGWAYGVPVLVCLLGLSVVTVTTLHRNAVRPFLSMETAGAEQATRSGIATGAVRIATGGALLSLAGAWRFIASSGSASELTIQGDTPQRGTYEMAWRFAEFAAIAGWLAPVVEIAGFVLLLLVIRQLRGGTAGKQSATHAVRAAQSTAVR
ncbi:hypothetical protein [Microbacterium sp.]|uniref:hypothetical protein n=2 Tax=Microbacterium TaxID=33882 RepID=UPI00051A61AE